MSHAPRQPITVTPAEAGLKLIGFLERRLVPDIPRSALMRWIRGGQVRVDGSRAKPFDRLAAGQLVRLPPQAHAQLRAQTDSHAPASGAETTKQSAAAQGLSIVHQDERLIVLAKPAGLPVQPGSRHADSLATRLAAFFAGEAYVPAPAHRLDRDTSGLVLAGRTHEAQLALHDLFAGRRDARLTKDYLAWVQGDWPHEGALLLEDRLEKSGPRGRERIQAVNGPGKAAVSAAAVLERRGERTLLLLRLYTGRRHQLRVQLASRGHPIVGDRKYVGPAFSGLQGLALHAWRLAAPGFGEFEASPEWPHRLAVPEELLTEARWAELPALGAHAT